MFFVTDSVTTDGEEFESAVRAFLDALLPGSPFLMAFMQGSRGHEVNDDRNSFCRCATVYAWQTLRRMPSATPTPHGTCFRLTTTGVGTIGLTVPAPRAARLGGIKG
jgi:hypothetical protein